MAPRAENKLKKPVNFRARKGHANAANRADAPSQVERCHTRAAASAPQARSGDQCSAIGASRLPLAATQPGEHESSRRAVAAHRHHHTRRWCPPTRRRTAGLKPTLAAGEAKTTWRLCQRPNSSSEPAAANTAETPRPVSGRPCRDAAECQLLRDHRLQRDDDHRRDDRAGGSSPLVCCS